jgi:exonuclease III
MRIAAVIERTEPKNRNRMKKLLDGGYADRIRSEIRESKIFEWLIAQAKVKDVPGGS